MSFLTIYDKYSAIDLDKVLNSVSRTEIEHAILSDRINDKGFLALLSAGAEDLLEEMAHKAHFLTLKNFGKAMQLYTPMYISDYCENECVYCGFSQRSKETSKKLSLEEVESEARFIASTGLKHILILTGSSRTESPIAYIKECVEVLKKHFSSISIEIYALTQEEYKEMVDCGVDGLTIYQEVYDKEVYDRVHLSGIKKNYRFRIEAPERAATEGMRVINIGALLGLNDWRKEVFFAGIHAKFLQDKYPSAEISVSVPRLRPYSGDFISEHTVTDKEMVQIITALRIYLPRVGIALSTREDAQFRENVMPLGITRMSAGSTTAVGGHTAEYDKDPAFMQFDIADKRDVSEIRKMLKSKGYQPVLKDWMDISKVNI